MTRIPGLALRHLLIGAYVWRHGYERTDQPITVLDILPMADPVDDVAVVLDWDRGTGRDELHAMLVRDLVRPPAQIDVTDGAWMDWRARMFRMDLAPAEGPSEPPPVEEVT